MMTKPTLIEALRADARAKLAVVHTLYDLRGAAAVLTEAINLVRTAPEDRPYVAPDEDPDRRLAGACSCWRRHGRTWSRVSNTMAAPSRPACSACAKLPPRLDKSPTLRTAGWGFLLFHNEGRAAEKCCGTPWCTASRTRRQIPLPQPRHGKAMACPEADSQGKSYRRSRPWMITRPAGGAQEQKRSVARHRRSCL